MNARQDPKKRQQMMLAGAERVAAGCRERRRPVPKSTQQIIDAAATTTPEKVRRPVVPTCSESEHWLFSEAVREVSSSKEEAMPDLTKTRTILKHSHSVERWGD